MPNLAAATPRAITREQLDRVQDFASAATSENTRRAYAGQWRSFSAWCAARGLEALPASPGTVALYASALADAGRKVASIEQAMAAVSAAHGAAGHTSPRDDANLRKVLRGIRRTLGTAQRQAAPVLADHLRGMLAALPPTLAGKRDAALMLVGFVGAFRRSELVGLEVPHLVFSAEGVTVTLRKSKVDQEARGRLVALPCSSTPAACPVAALRAWLDASAITSGPVFREVDRHGKVRTQALTGRSVARLVKKAAASVGLDPSTFSGHSLRAGFVTQAKLSQRAEDAIMRQTGHRSATMLRKYDRRAELWRDNAAAGLL